MKHILFLAALILAGLCEAMAQTHPQSYLASDTWDENGHRYAEKLLTVALIPHTTQFAGGIEFTLKNAEEDSTVLRQLSFGKDYSSYTIHGDKEAWTFALHSADNTSNLLRITQEYVTHCVTFYQENEERNISCNLSTKEIENLRKVVIAMAKRIGIKKDK